MSRFGVKRKGVVVSDLFESESEAEEWMERMMDGGVKKLKLVEVEEEDLDERVEEFGDCWRFVV